MRAEWQQQQQESNNAHMYCFFLWLVFKVKNLYYQLKYSDM